MQTTGSAKKGSSHEYLMQLQEKNRLLKKLQHKSSGQRMLEQREQGFSLYLNGANAASLQLPVRHTRKQISDKQNRNTKTAGSNRINGSHANQSSEQSDNTRAKTAPMKERLKWGSHSCDVTAVDGEVVHIPPPDSKFTGNYEDDFEVTMGTGGHDNPTSIQLDLSIDNSKILKEALEEAIGDQDDDMDENCSDDSIGCSSDLDHDQDDNVPVTMYAASVPKATQSLSAVQRRQPTRSSGVSADVLLAVQLENNAISHTSTATTTTTAQQPHPPATPSTAKTITIVTEQVKMMNYKQQKKLLQILEQLERLPSPPLSSLEPNPHTTHSKLHSHSVDEIKGKSHDRQLPSSAGTQRRTSFDWLNDSVQHSQSVNKLSNIIGVEEEKRPLSRLPSGRTSGLRGLLKSGGHRLEDSNKEVQAKSETHLPTFLDHPRSPVTMPTEPRLTTAVISRRRSDLCLPSAEDTDVTELYHMTRSHDHPQPHDSMMQPSCKLSPHGLPASHDPVSYDPITVSHNLIKASYNPMKVSSHDPIKLSSPDQVKPSHDPMIASYDPMKLSSHDPIRTSCDPIKISSCGLPTSHDPGTLSSHDVDTSMASLSIFDTTHLGRLGTAVTVETSNYGDSLDSTNCYTDIDQKIVTIPVLPRGKLLTFNILSTWGDHHYVGLNGIELFTNDGSPVLINTITADPPDINILPGYHSDPRIVTNLLDGVNMTRDDFHMWLTPFTPGKDHVIHITLNDITTIAMIRIWNYNKSRIHSCRGARHVMITLDDQVVFDGELARASGELNCESINNYGDTILFTTDDEILLKIANCDQMFQREQLNNIDIDKENSRPSTAGMSPESHKDNIEITKEIEPSPLLVNVVTASPQVCMEDTARGGWVERQIQHKAKPIIQLNLITTWGDPYYVGLTGIAILGEGLEPLLLSADQIQASPQDLNDLPEYTDDDRTLDKLVDGVNVTTCDTHMWLAPYTARGDHVITITLKAPAMVAGLQIWNYNKSPEDTRRGVKQVMIIIDDHVINGDHVISDDHVSNENSYWIFRQAPGHDHYDYGQMILFDANNNGVIQLDNFITFPVNMSTVTMPTGFIYELQLLTTWGDAYYVGLNGLEVFANDGSQLLLTNNNIAAFPESVNALEGSVIDVRTPDKLIDGCYDTTEGGHMWLAPILPDVVNKVYIIFDTIVTLGAIKVWNYAKTPTRGVRELSILVDGLLIYNGEIPMADTRPCLPSLTPCISAHVIFLGDHMIKPSSHQQDVQLTNDNHVIHSHSHHPHHSKLVADQALRPVTSLTSNSSNKIFSKR